MFACVAVVGLATSDLGPSSTEVFAEIPASQHLVVHQVAGTDDVEGWRGHGRACLTSREGLGMCINHWSVVNISHGET